MQVQDIIGLWKPAEILIEKFCNAVGILWEPHKIKRASRAQAEADVESERIRALWRIETIQTLTEFQKRGSLRRIHEDWIQQENLEKILLWTPQFLWENANPENLDNDWMRNFSEKAKMTSDEEMQNIWSRILAWEWTRPWSFSKRTVNKVHELEKQDAELFTKLCSFCINKWNPQPLIFKHDDKIYSDMGIHFSTLKHLDSIWLISFESLAWYRFTWLSKKISIDYFWKTIFLELSKESENELEIGKVMLTSIWKEIASICSPRLVEWFEKFIIEYWKNIGINVTT